MVVGTMAIGAIVHHLVWEVFLSTHLFRNCFRIVHESSFVLDSMLSLKMAPKFDAGATCINLFYPTQFAAGFFRISSKLLFDYCFVFLAINSGFMQGVCVLSVARPFLLTCLTTAMFLG